jgi:hypothetical protein
MWVQVILLSMKDMNIPKLTSTDLPLFNGIMSDLFPGIETSVVDYSKVRIMSPCSRCYPGNIVSIADGNVKHFRVHTRKWAIKMLT